MEKYKIKFQENLDETDDLLDFIDGPLNKFEEEVHLEFKNFVSSQGDKLLQFFTQHKLTGKQLDEITEYYTVEEEDRDEFHEVLDNALTKYFKSKKKRK